ncbi:MAG: hypothetical protein KY467_19175, partial [Gemmatimonadetes bacterium]|nr:hypothetical protein [Gemmatimonadota bacterium]
MRAQEKTEPASATPTARTRRRPPLRAVPAVDALLPRAVRPQPVPPEAPLDHPSLYFNRELGLLDFN